MLYWVFFHLPRILSHASFNTMIFLGYALISHHGHLWFEQGQLHLCLWCWAPTGISFNGWAWDTCRTQVTQFWNFNRKRVTFLTLASKREAHTQAMTTTFPRKKSNCLRMKLTQKKALRDRRRETLRPKRQGLKHAWRQFYTWTLQLWEPIGGGQERTWLPVDPQAGLSNWRFLTPSPVLGMYALFTVPTVEAVSWTQPWENNVLLSPYRLNMDSTIGNLSITQDKPHHRSVPLHSNSVTDQSGVPASFGSLLAPCIGASLWSNRATKALSSLRHF